MPKHSGAKTFLLGSAAMGALLLQGAFGPAYAATTSPDPSEVTQPRKPARHKPAPATHGAPAQGATQRQAADKAAASSALKTSSEDITVSGTAAPGNNVLSTSTRRHSTTQVTVISASDLKATGQTNLIQALSQMMPSVSAPPLPGVGNNAFVQTMQLRGLSADQTLILVNGHRRHLGANFNANAGPNWGTEPADISLIPVGAVDHIEVITEGATALYGQDAIAGAVNIVLKEDTQGLSADFKNSGYYAGDGQALDGSITKGFAIGRHGGYLDLSAQITHQLPTSRTGDYINPATYPNDLYYALPGGQVDPRAAALGRNIQRILGIPKQTRESISANMGIPITDSIKFYSTDTYGHRRVNAAENFRSAADDLTVNAIWPNGMQPYLDLEENDFEVDNGFKGTTAGFNWDTYVNYGRDIQRYWMQDTDNPTYGVNSPTKFDTGSAVTSQLTAGFRASHALRLGFLPKLANVEFGAEYRRDMFAMGPGVYESYGDGGVPILEGPNAGKTANPGSADHAGNPPLAVTNQNRDVYDGHVNLDFYVLPRWEWTLGGRATSYNNLATVTTGSVGTRYNFSDRFALRASINTGYRPPTLGQEYYFYSAPFATYSIDQLPSNSAPARALGAHALKGEYSRSYSVGVDATPVDNWHVTGNLYYIAINDRLASTTTLGGAGVGALLASAGLGNVTYASYYTNPVNTATYGGDIATDYSLPTRRLGTFRFAFSVSLTDNEIRSSNAVPQVLQSMNLAYFNQYARTVLLHSAPKNRENLSMNWSRGRWSAFVQESRYGSLIYAATPSLPTNLWLVQRPAFITNIEVSYRVLPQWTVAVGANNLGDKYPTRLNPKSIATSFNAYKYSFFSPYGFNGGMYYVRTGLNF
ncbi:TonB-dependent receptor plug [Gluconacetobacter diazotrophicus PA1 5]|uniref:TonB-dependent receptor n=1 Tax=Gluconacetobacter diazotrophicus TaxID=33996 RepID=A0A7W4I714_GLUDI|nr:TonB-dependent receptor [Gluconacetobacter diazotrophicus]ACI52031.1 TonB-dependent receptor plug [Gluconacetobacter diazotrophicus PA1 5]MBB2157458.1 TonB-dependent receptor [Gluconacetobacter diazotrophicus]TWB05224.1 iron complex outermembrane receptor protein [Gluconacetobacter diazotrophicus]